MLKAFIIIFFAGLVISFFYFNLDKLIPTAQSASVVCPTETALTGSNPVARWKLDDGSFTSIADSAGSNPGTLNLGSGGNMNPANAWQPQSVCKIGQCLKFDGTDDLVNFGDVPGTRSPTTGPPATQLTVSYWINPATLVAGDTHIARWQLNTTSDSNVWGIRQSSASEVFVFIGNGSDDGTNFFSTNSNLNLTINTWTHIAFVYDGTQTGNSNRLKVYKNGTPVIGSFPGALNTIPASLNPGTSEPVTIARRLTIGHRFLNGMLDDVQIYNKALVDNDIITLYRNGTPTVEGLITAGGSTLKGFYNVQGNCIQGPEAIVNLGQATIIKKIDTYEGLKEQFYNKSTITKVTLAGGSTLTPAAPPNGLQGPKLYLAQGDLIVEHINCYQNVTNNTGFVLIFVDGNLKIRSNVAFGTGECGNAGTAAQDRGLVFIVRGKIDIYWNTTSSSTQRSNRIDAVLIAEGKQATGTDYPYSICTAYDPSTDTGDCDIGYVNVNESAVDNPLVVNGSLISLNLSEGSTNPLPFRFRRILNDNTVPAEQVNTQAKYLPLLKGIMSRDLIVPFQGP